MASLALTAPQRRRILAIGGVCPGCRVIGAPNSASSRLGYRGWAGLVGSPWEGGLIVGAAVVWSIDRGAGGSGDFSGAKLFGEPLVGSAPASSSFSLASSTEMTG